MATFDASSGGDVRFFAGLAELVTGIVIGEFTPEADIARGCLAAYYAELNRRFAGGFDVARSRDPDAADLVRPRGAFLVAQDAGRAVGCVALKGSGGTTAEIKRLWTDPAARGRGVARHLMRAAEAVAAELGVTVLRLDTGSVMPEAVALYRTDGWVEIPRFNDDPYPDRFFEKRLSPPAPRTPASATPVAPDRSSSAAAGS